jgi:hypothetical protein
MTLRWLETEALAQERKPRKLPAHGVKPWSGLSLMSQFR